jgi:hypothetical protein
LTLPLLSITNILAAFFTTTVNDTVNARSLKMSVKEGATIFDFESSVTKVAIG